MTSKFSWFELLRFFSMTSSEFYRIQAISIEELKGSIVEIFLIFPEILSDNTRIWNRLALYYCLKINGKCSHEEVNNKSVSKLHIFLVNVIMRIHPHNVCSYTTLINRNNHDGKNDLNEAYLHYQQDDAPPHSNRYHNKKTYGSTNNYRLIRKRGPIEWP